MKACIGNAALKMGKIFTCKNWLLLLLGGFLLPLLLWSSSRCFTCFEEPASKWQVVASLFGIQLLILFRCVTDLSFKKKKKRVPVSTMTSQQCWGINLRWSDYVYK